MTEEEKMDIDLDVFNLVRPLVNEYDNEGVVYIRSSLEDNNKVGVGSYISGDRNIIINSLVDVMEQDDDFLEMLSCAMLTVLMEKGVKPSILEEVKHFLER